MSSAPRLVSAAPVPHTLPPSALAHARELYARGRCVEAYAQLLAHGPLTSLGGTAARVLAGRVLAQVGAPRTGEWLHLRAFREDPGDAEALYCAALETLQGRGPLSALALLERRAPNARATAEQRADLLRVRASALAHLRDFEAARALLDEADALSGETAWGQVQRAHQLQREDRREEALVLVQASLALRPSHRTGLQFAAHLLQELGRDAEALALLQDAAARLESCMVVAQLASLQQELGQHAQAWESWERALTLAPAMEPKFFQWLAARRSDVAALTGQRELAVHLARLSDSPFHRAVAERMERAAAEARRVLLPVGHVRQHHMTCAPATLAALGGLWGLPVGHLEVAEAICYNGTPAHQERTWAAENGWWVREFTVTWEAAVALLDRGVPFTLTTVESDSAHLQAVVGYDAARGTLLVRDPGTPYLSELDAERGLERYAASGPRGMALVPLRESARLDGVVLPDAEHYDALHALERALLAHERPRAVACVEQLEARAPGHRLALEARRVLAHYDADSTRALDAVKALRERYPTDPRLVLEHVGCLRDVGRPAERLALLREAARAPAADPALAQALGEELCDDAREHAQAALLLERSVRRRSGSAPAYRALAHLRWVTERRPEALRLYHWAACLDDLGEHHADSFFRASLALGRVDEALAVLRARFTRLGRRAAGPARTLASALVAVQRDAEALEVYDAALRLRPQDAELALSAADAFARCGEGARAATLLAAARGGVKPSAWLRCAARLAVAAGEAGDALLRWREVLALEPLALDAHEAVAELLVGQEGPEAARAHLAAACERFPHHLGLLHAHYQRCREEDGPTALAALERLLALHPTEPWALRERALLLDQHGRAEEAWAELERARAVEPSSAALHHIEGGLHERAGHPEQARAVYRRSLAADVDSALGIRALLGLSNAPAARAEALAFLREELERQRHHGEGLLALQGAVYADGEEGEAMLAFFEAQYARRPDLAEASAALVRQALALDKSERAREVALAATQRFALQPGAWLELARLHRARGEVQEEREALEAALRVRPGHRETLCELAEACQRAGDSARARALFERAVRDAPLDPPSHGYLADFLWEAGEHEAAWERLLQALRLSRGYDWAWGRLLSWASARGRRPEALAFAREQVAKGSGDPCACLAVAQLLQDSGEDGAQERFAALAEAVRLAPRRVTAHDERAQALARAGRFEEAAEACTPSVFGTQPPLPLRGRLIWVRAERGDREGAIAEMQALVDECPDYGWGLGCLARWHHEEGHGERARAAAERLVAVEPEGIHGHLQLGEACSLLKDRSAAIAAFTRALAINPTSGYAALSLFDEQFAVRDLEAAARTLEQAEPHAEPPFWCARAVQLAARRGQRERALEQAQRLVAMDEAHPWPLQAVTEALRNAGWEKALRRALDARLALPEQAPENVLSAWAAQYAPFRALLGMWRLRGMPAAQRGPAAGAFAEALGEQERSLVLRLFVFLFGSLLRGSTALWGKVGYGLLRCNQLAAVHAWGRDWQRRPDAEPWMLSNLAHAAAFLGRRKALRALVTHALTLPASHVTQKLQAWEAWLLALEGRDAAALSRAAQRLEAPWPGETPSVVLTLNRLTRALLVGRRALSPELGERERVALLGELLKAVPGSMWQISEPSPWRKLQGPSAWRIARAGGPRRWLWWLRYG